MILETALSHFNQDIERAKQLYQLSLTQENSLLKNDLKRCAWMFAVGALDAFFCDAYGDLLARTLRAKQLEPSIPLPEKIKNIRIPAVSIISNNQSESWRWRMVARDVIELDNVLSIDKIQNLFNHFCRDSHKIISSNSNSFENWILHTDSKYRLFNVRISKYRHSNRQEKTVYKKAAVKHIKARFKLIFQRRHDCIHNCDRPKIAVQRAQISDTFVARVIEDIEFLVNRITEDLRIEYREYLIRLDFNSITRNRVGI